MSGDEKDAVKEPSPRSRFGPYVIDRADHRLWRGDEAIALAPKAFDLLSHLVAHAGTLASKDDLLDAIWPDTYVSDAVLKVTVGEVRRALDDSAQDPKWIQTVHRRGYRFIGNVENDGGPVAARARPTPSAPIEAAGVVGRSYVFAELERCTSEAWTGDRRTVFLTGAPGLGKTAIVDRVEAHHVALGTLVARGQCRESYGQGEAYLPILEAVAGLYRGASAQAVMPILRRHAPSWLLQMPWVLEDDDRAAVEEAARHVGRERMLREIADGLEELCRDRPLVLLLEDLHWSDPSTVDVLSTLAQRTSPARLVIVGTYRPIDAIVSRHPVRSLKQDLVSRGRCVELGVTPLEPTDVGEYMTHRLTVSPPEELVSLVHRRTEGNALYVTTFVGDLIDQECIERIEDRLELRTSMSEIEALFPEGLKQILERHVERLEPDAVELLECASVLGRGFRADTVARLLDGDATQVEARLESLGRRQDFVQSAGVERVEGRVTGRYEFGHVLHQHALYDRLGTVRRADLHGRAAEELARAGAGPAELAYHFHAGGRLAEAMEHWHRAGDVAMGRKASVEAIGHYERALSLVGELSDEAEREERELRLLTAIGPALGNVFGHGGKRVEEVYLRARELAGRRGADAEMMGVLAGLFQFYVSRAQCPAARDVAAELRPISDAQSEPLIHRSGILLCGVASFYLGELADAQRDLERTIALAEGDPAPQWGYVADGQACAFSAQVHHLMGETGIALARAEAATELGIRAGDPFAETIGYHFGSVIHRWRRDVEATRDAAQKLVATAEENGFELWQTVGRWTLGWVDAVSGDGPRGLDEMTKALDAYAETGNATARTDYVGTQASVCLALGDADQGLELVEAALDEVARTHERFYEAELHRLRGALLGLRSDPSAIDAVNKAIEVAVGQGALVWELRARVTLCELGEDDAEGALATLLDRLPSDVETADLDDARRVLGRS